MDRRAILARPKPPYMKYPLTLLMLLLLSLSAFVHADEWTNSPPDTAQNQMELNFWASQQFTEADDELNRVWNELLPKLESKEKDALTDAQVLWVKFRDANANASAASYEGGSIQPYIYSQSRTQSTRMRTYQLKQRLDELVRLGN